MSGAAARRWLSQPVDAAGLAAFRVLFGALMVASVVRFAAYGWIDELYIAPQYHFTYLGFDWVKPWSGAGMYAHFVLMGLTAAGVCVGVFYRLCVAVFFVTFTYVELIDKATYLNHYYLVSLLSFLLMFVPAHRVWSVDTWWRHRKKQRACANATNASVARWCVLLLRAQVGLVYLFAGIAKLNADWLLRAQPLRAWLVMRVETPLIGTWIDNLWLAYAMSWAGVVFDLCAPGLLLLRRTRAIAFAAMVVFHVTTWSLFPIGVFPWVMIASVTLFFTPSWPRRWMGRSAAAPTSSTQSQATSGASSHVPAASASNAAQSPTPGAAPKHAKRLTSSRVLGMVVLYLAVQVAAPLRFLLYPGDVNWTEQGFRFSWRVMLIEKVGMAEIEVRDAAGHSWAVYPRDDLTPLQLKMMVTQPDMIHQYALYIAQRERAAGRGDVEVFAHVWITYNGRPSVRLIDPDIDLAKAPRDLSHKPWILPRAGTPR